MNIAGVDVVCKRLDAGGSQVGWQVFRSGEHLGDVLRDTRSTDSKIAGTRLRRAGKGAVCWKAQVPRTEWDYPTNRDGDRMKKWGRTAGQLQHCFRRRLSPGAIRATMGSPRGCNRSAAGMGKRRAGGIMIDELLNQHEIEVLESVFRDAECFRMAAGRVECQTPEDAGLAREYEAIRVKLGVPG